MQYGRMISIATLTCCMATSLGLAQGTISGSQGNWMVHTASKPGCPGLVLQIGRVGDNLKGFATTGTY